MRREVPRHVRLLPVGRGRAAAVLCPRPVRDQAPLLHPGRRRFCTSRPRRRPCCRSSARSRPTRTRFKDYLYFQLCLDGKTLFKNVKELSPATCWSRASGQVQVRRYWQVYYEIDFDHTEKYFERADPAGCCDSVDIHKRADVPIGGYISGGLDSSIVAAVADAGDGGRVRGLHRQVHVRQGVRREPYARPSPSGAGFPLHELDITADDFVGNIRKVLYHLDFPVAGPGSFPQYMVSKLAATRRKVVLGRPGRRRDLRRLRPVPLAYFDQCIKGGDRRDLQERQLRRHLRVDHPEPVDAPGVQAAAPEVLPGRPFDNRSTSCTSGSSSAPTLGDEVNWAALDGYDVFETFRRSSGPTTSRRNRTST